MTIELSRGALLVLGHLEDRVDALLLRGVDERARVDHDDVGALGLLHERVTGRLDLAEHQLGVNLVLRATKRHEVDLVSGVYGRGHSGGAVWAGAVGVSTTGFRVNNA